MPTVLRQFPEISRSGTQQTAYVQLGQHYDSIHLEGQASAAVLSDPLNAIEFVVLASPTGTDADAYELQREGWGGGTRVNKITGLTEPNPIDVAFGLDARYVNAKVALRATFNRAIVVGATLTGLP